MTNPTSNFGWQMPTSTDLVTDLPADFETFGQAVDTSLADLKGGTTGQILSKASNTDMDFTWVANDVGDITAVTAGTGITGGGTSGAVTVSFDQANFGGGQYAAGKNKIINGDFNVWQRGTSFTNPVTGDYTSDRWRVSNASANPTTRTISQQTFTAGTAPVAGYEGTFFLRSTLTTKGTTTGARLEQRIENVRTFAGQTTTMSFWAKSDAARTNDIIIQQNFGSGGSASTEPLNTTFATTTAWTRFTFEVALPSISGKTVGTNSFLSFRVGQENTDGCVLDLWGVQVEAGSVATPFQTASGTLQGELALCQRYYYRTSADSAGSDLAIGQSATVNDARIVFYNPVSMRVAPTALEQSGTAGDYSIREANAIHVCTSVPVFYTASKSVQSVTLVATGLLTAGRANSFRAVNTSAFLGWSAEL